MLSTLHFIKKYAATLTNMPLSVTPVTLHSPSCATYGHFSLVPRLFGRKKSLVYTVCARLIKSLPPCGVVMRIRTYICVYVRTYNYNHVCTYVRVYVRLAHQMQNGCSRDNTTTKLPTLPSFMLNTNGSTS